MESVANVLPEQSHKDTQGFDGSGRENPESAAKLLRYALLKVAHVLFDPNQPRKSFDSEQYEETKASIKEIGLQVPITVNPGPVRDGVQYYYVKYGESRLRIHVELGLEEIQCIIDTYQYNGVFDIQRVITQAAENINRANHTHGEIAAVYGLYLKERQNGEGKVNLSDIQAEFAKIFGKSITWVQNYAALSGLLPDFLARVDCKGPSQIPFWAAVALGRNKRERQASILSTAETFAGTRRDLLQQYIVHAANTLKRAHGERIQGKTGVKRKSLTDIPLKALEVITNFGAGMPKVERSELIEKTMRSLSVLELREMLKNISTVLQQLEHLRALAQEKLEDPPLTKATNEGNSQEGDGGTLHQNIFWPEISPIKSHEPQNVDVGVRRIKGGRY